MTAIVDFVNARLAEDEQIAQAAAAFDGPDWTAGEDGDLWMVSGDKYAVAFDEGVPTVEQAAHIARHDPARVLREVAAKRSTVDMHRDCGGGIGYCDDGGHGWDDVGCGDLANLASVWSDHPDYQPEWAPNAERLEGYTDWTKPEEPA